jgi:hypothetical protein
MANKKTVVENFDAIKAMLNGETVEGYTLADALTFLDKRIEITEKKNANRGNGNPTPKQLEKMAVDTNIENAVLSVMVNGETYTASDIVKLLDRADVPNTQKLTPRLTALVTDGKVVKGIAKGRSVYSLPSTAEVEGE